MTHNKYFILAPTVFTLVGVNSKDWHFRSGKAGRFLSGGAEPGS